MINNKGLAVICDFDGTISLQDVNFNLFQYFGDEKNQKIEEAFQNDEMGSLQSMIAHYNNLDLSKREFENFVKNRIELDPYFAKFYQLIKENNIDFAIVSAGYINYINLLFEKYNIKMEDPVYCNKLIFKDNKIDIEFLHSITEDECTQDYGICGNCKRQIIEKYIAQGKYVIYIGDGLTDRCPAKKADKLFTRKGSRLEKYCQENDINFTSFGNFKKIISYIKNYM